MSSAVLKYKRITSQLAQINKNPPQKWKITQVDQSNWNCWITCDSSCPFYGVPFLLKINFPQNFPFSPPNFNLQDYKKFYHPNISNVTGNICHKDIKSSQMIRVRQRVQAFITLLQVANPNSPQNFEAAKRYSRDQKEYYRKAVLIFRGQLQQ